MEVGRKSKEVIARLRAKLFESCGNWNNRDKTSLTGRAEGQHFPQGREPGFVLNRVVKGKVFREEVEEVGDFGAWL